MRVSTARARIPPSRDSISSFPKPVSYTHLDVYKRQGKALADDGRAGLVRNVDSGLVNRDVDEDVDNPITR